MKVLISSADFGTNNPEVMSIPNQIGYDFVFNYYNDYNTHSRELSLTPRTKGKIPKMMSWMDYDADFYIWIDSKFRVKSERFIEVMVEKLYDSDICLFRHPSRISIEEELNFVTQRMSLGDEYLLSRYKGERMVGQVSRYLEDPDFVDDSLFAMGLFAYSKRLVDNKSNNLMTDWLLHNYYWSVQDQFSFPYLLQKHGVKYSCYDFDIFENDIVYYDSVCKS